MTRTDADVLRAFAIAIVVSAGLLVLAFAGYIAATTAHTFATDGGWYGDRDMAVYPIACFTVIAACLAGCALPHPPVWKSVLVLVACVAFGPLFFSSFFHRPTKGVLPLWPLSSPPS